MLAVESTVTPALQLITFQAADTSNWRTSRRGEKTLITRDVSFPPFIHNFSHFAKFSHFWQKTEDISLFSSGRFSWRPNSLRLVRNFTSAFFARHLQLLFDSGFGTMARCQRFDLKGSSWRVGGRGLVPETARQAAPRCPPPVGSGCIVTSAGNLVHHQRPVSSRSALTEDR